MLEQLDDWPLGAALFAEYANVDEEAEVTQCDSVSVAK
jgi:hypothetical protein